MSAPPHAVTPPAAAPAPRASEARRELANVYFDLDRADIRPDQVPTLERNLDALQRDPAVQVRIEGHCDERGTIDYNLALGHRRAEAARTWLSLHGVAPSRMETLSYGEERPVDRGHHERAWQRNRRVEFHRIEPASEAVAER